MTDRLAIEGGRPVRDVSSRPWPVWPTNPEERWDSRIAPALREVYLSRTEGLPKPRAGEFAAKLAAFCGARFGVLLTHGTDAIAAAVAGVLDLDGLGDGGEVIVPDYTFIASASGPLSVRCSMAFVDIDPDYFTISPEAVEAAIVPGRTRAILPVHLGGHPADMGAIHDIAARHGLAVIEDCAQAHGAEWNGRRVGPLGSAGAFSFQSSKNLTCGEGGAVVTNDEAIFERIYSFMDVGRRPGGQRWEYPRLGWNFRPSEYLAALLTVRLDDLDAEMARRDACARRLDALANIPGVTPARKAPWCTRHAYHLYMMLVDPARFGGRSRDEIVDALRAEGVPCMTGYRGGLTREGAIAVAAKKHPHLIRTCPTPHLDHVCQRSIWLAQQMLLAEPEDMDDIVRAMAKIQRAFSGT